MTADEARQCFWDLDSVLRDEILIRVDIQLEEIAEDMGDGIPSDCDFRNGRFICESEACMDFLENKGIRIQMEPEADVAFADPEHQRRMREFEKHLLDKVREHFTEHMHGADVKVMTEHYEELYPCGPVAQR